MDTRRKLTLLAALASALVGVLAASGGYTFVTAHGTSYLSDDPKVCVNCHIMREQYDGWRHGSHHAVATCNDCHMPHDSALGKMIVKASNGWSHSKAFTTGNFPEPIRIKPSNAEVLEANCRRCHKDLTSEVSAHGTLGVPSDPMRKADLYGCVKCHTGAGHGSQR